MDRYICVHGHFYQPPRENPWIDAVETQDSARPYHDWNERVTRECYAPNASSRILDAEGRIVRIVNNYGRISFNFGPTLLAWMEEGDSETYRAILAADRESRSRFSGHGSAMAQAYNHMIMPLANARDRVTQVRWGVRDFERRFGRRPEGMWLPEAAVDVPTLEALAAGGIRFTVLAPHQAARVRRLGARSWQRAGGGIDPSMAYQARLRPGAGRLSVFFYDGPISHAVAFERLLDDGGAFARRLQDGFDPRRSWPQLVNIATDGESYGHHHRHGDMALAYALQQIEAQGAAALTNYGQFLALHPPTHEVEIVEDSSWSCAHGVERWRADCGCSTGSHAGWRQSWRGPLREALDRLRDRAAGAFEERGARLLRDPWAARDDYIDVVLDRSPENVDNFLDRHGRYTLPPEERVEALKLLELQRHAMLMYTSCGWFFDEVSGIETVQVMQYAGRVVQLAQDLFGGDWEGPLQADLARAPSNLPEHGDAAAVYRRFVAPAAIDLLRVGAHYAVSSVLEPDREETRLYCYDVHREDWRRQTAGQSAVAVGRARVASRITRESADLAFAAFHFGDQNLTAAVRPYRGEADYQRMEEGVAGAFQRGDVAEVVRLLDRYFDRRIVTPRLLFRDQQRRVLARLLDVAVSEAEALHRQIYDRHATLMALLRELGVPQPRVLLTAAEIVLDGELQSALAGPQPRRERVVSLLDEAARLDVPLDDLGLGYTIQGVAEERAARLAAQPSDLERLRSLQAAVELALTPPLRADLWRVQNVYYDLLLRVRPERQTAAAAGDASAREWLEVFAALGEPLRVRGPQEL